MTNADVTPQTPNRNLAPRPTFEPRTYTGGCVCGAVRFEVEIDFSAGTTRCNCSICAKASLWSALVSPDAFKLVSGADQLLDFQRNGKFSHYLFCKTCGVRSFGHGDAPWTGGAYYAVQIPCLDLDEADLAGVTIRHFDGRHDNWAAGPRLEQFVPA